MVQILWKTVSRFLKKLKKELLYDTATTLLGIYSKVSKTRSRRDIRVSTFTTALFTMAKMWQEP